VSSTGLETLAHDVATDASSPGEGVLRIARYTVYPRAARNHGIQAGYTRNVPSGVSFVLVTPTPEAIGELLRINLRGLGERDAHDTLARVVSCRQVAESRFELSLKALEARWARAVRGGRTES
jgi:hypothetical protein